MTDQYDVGPLSRTEQHTMRPVRNAIIVNALLIVAGFLLDYLSPGLFSSVGGWVTVIILVVVSAVVGTFVAVRRMARRSAMPDERFESPRTDDPQD